MGVEWPVALALMLVAGLAGFVDAVAGGGGLLQLPALFAALGASPTALGVNKMASICGTTAAVIRYAANGNIVWKRLAWAGPLALVASVAGAKALLWLDRGKETSRAIEPVFAACFLALAVQQVWRATRKSGTAAPGRERAGAGLAFIAAIGLYDGFIGPGTGIFLFWAFTTWFGLEALDATGTTKAVNWLTNVGALSALLADGKIIWPLAAAMASTNTIGGFFGARAAIRRGVTFIRFLTAAVSAAAAVYLLFGPNR